MAAMPFSNVVKLRAAFLNAEAEPARIREVYVDLAARVVLLELQNEKMLSTGTEVSAHAGGRIS